MNSKFRARLLCLLTLGAVLSIAVMVRGQGQELPQEQRQATPSQPGMNQPGPPKSAEQVYKNIQVLKGVPPQQIIPALQFMTASLGVQCEFCHVEGKFDQDDKKPKQIARKMMQMMFAINKDNFDGQREVTCYSCHQGQTKPALVPLIAEVEGGPVVWDRIQGAESIRPSLPNLDQILDKYVDALGGAKALLAIRTLAEKGSATFGGYEVPIEIYAKAPDKRASVMHMNGAENTTIYDGTSAWAAAPGRGLREMHGADLDAAKIDAELLFPGNIKQSFPDLKVSGAEKLNDHEAYLVLARHADQPPVKLYFDRQSGLLLRLVRYSDSPLGMNPTEIDYADYRTVEGVKVPFRWTTARPGNRFTIQMNQIQQNVPVDDVRFAKPTDPPDGAQKSK